MLEAIYQLVTALRTEPSTDSEMTSERKRNIEIPITYTILRMQVRTHSEFSKWCQAARCRVALITQHGGKAEINEFILSRRSVFAIPVGER